MMTITQPYLVSYGRWLAQQLQQEVQRLRTPDEMPAEPIPPWQPPATPVPFQQLAERFALSPQATAVIHMLLATEIDERLTPILAYLQGDARRRWFTPALVWRVLGLAADSLQAHQSFDQLTSWHLVHTANSENGHPLPLLHRPLKLDDRIVAHLLGHDRLDPLLVDFVELAPPEAQTRSCPAAVQTTLDNITAVWQGQPIWLWGRVGAGKTAAAHHLAHALGKPLLIVHQLPAPEQWWRIQRERRLRDGLIYVPQFTETAEAQQLWRRLGEGVLLGAAAPPTDTGVPLPYTIHLPPPSQDERVRQWQSHLNGNGNPSLTSELASRFRLTPGQIQQAAQTAQHMATLRAGLNANANREELFEGARQQSNPVLSRLASKIETTQDWNQLVLPPAQLAQLHTIESQAQHTHVVFEEWGFGQRVRYGKGITALFTGASGTGKTMSAGILARSLGLDLYKIDLSGVVSKYIGETEKNLHRIFSEAATASAILFFDEADALFGKRSEIKDAHDRYANIEVSYLLQKMEEYEGIAILATNFSQNLDEAFARRMQFVVNYPTPNSRDRARIWRGLFPPQAPQAADIDFPFLAEQFELTGGHIKNCVVAAAFSAAAIGEPINMTHLVQAVAHEFGKLGRPLQRAAFGAYFSLVKSGRGG